MTTPTFSSRIRLQLLLSIFAVLIVAVGALLRSDSALRAALRIPNFAGPAKHSLNDLLQPQEREKRDPELGSALPQGAVGTEVRAAVRSGKSGYLLLFVGDCTGCLKVNFPVWAKDRQDNLQLVGVTQAPNERIVELQSYQHQMNVQMPIVSDPNVEIIGAINSYYAGRAYLYSPKWKLEWMAHTLNSDSGFWDNPGFLRALEEARQAN